MKKYISIQYLRALAALMVVFHHARNPFAGLYDPIADFGVCQAGVDIFFVISGFIMYSAARSEVPLEFARRRFIRIVPLYWIATIVYLIYTTRFLQNAYSFGHLIASLLFIPHYSPEVPGAIRPLLVPGWTLNYEVFFYAIFALGLKKKNIIFVIFTAIISCVVAGFLAKSRNPLWLTYTDPILLEFLAGVVIAKWSDSIVSRNSIILFPLGLILIGLSTFVNWPRIICWGVPAVMTVVGAIALERRQKLPDWKILGVLGDASYSIYLFHLVALGLAMSVLHRLPIGGLMQFIAMIGMGIAGSIVLGLAAHYSLERPVTRYLLGRRKFKHHGA